MSTKYIFIADDADSSLTLEAALGGVSHIDVAVSSLYQTFAVDAEFVGTMVANVIFGTTAVRGPNDIQIAPSPSKAHGSASYIMWGGGVNSDADWTTQFAIERFVAIGEAVRIFNGEHEQPIQTVAIWLKFLLDPSRHPLSEFAAGVLTHLEPPSRRV